MPKKAGPSRRRESADDQAKKVAERQQRARQREHERLTTLKDLESDLAAIDTSITTTQGELKELKEQREDKITEIRAVIRDETKPLLEVAETE